jgi:hypothetical protein
MLPLWRAVAYHLLRQEGRGWEPGLCPENGRLIRASRRLRCRDGRVGDGDAAADENADGGSPVSRPAGQTPGPHSLPLPVLTGVCYRSGKRWHTTSYDRGIANENQAYVLQTGS